MNLHLVGLPLSAHRRLADESNGWEGVVDEPHRFLSTPFASNDQQRFSSKELADIKDRMQGGWTHVIVAGNRRWQDVEKLLKFDCRVHVSRLGEPLREVQLQDLKNELSRVTALDAVWLSKISPADLRHALLLPPSMFRPARCVEGYWDRCAVYKPDGIPRAEKVLETVEREHRRPDKDGGNSWLDSKRMRYKFDPGRHAMSEGARAGTRDYRFCYEVISGFHYDVRDDRGGSFIVDGKSRPVKHCNVTPWGHIRA
jgi:hypothetical protein